MPKYILQQISFIVFRFSFYLLATAVTFQMVFGSPALIKRVFVDTHAYTRFVPAVIASAKQSGQMGSLPVNDPNVQKIIEESFPASILQIDTEAVIDATYAWLNGRTQKPAFVVDFSPSVTLLADKLSAYAISRLEMQPVCKTAPAEIDPFTATCRPEFFDYKQSQIDLEDAIKADNGILPKTKYTANDLPKMTNGKTIIEQYSYAPKIFVALRYAPIVLLATMLLSGLLIVYLARKKREAISRLGASAIASSLFIVLSPLFYIYVLPRFFPALSAGQSAGASVVLNDVINGVGSEFNNELILVGILLVLAGAAVVTLERATRPKSKYIKVSKKAGLVTSETPRNRKGKLRLKQADVPLQTSEGVRNTGKYQKDKSYRKIHAKEF